MSSRHPSRRIHCALGNAAGSVSSSPIFIRTLEHFWLADWIELRLPVTSEGLGLWVERAGAEKFMSAGLHGNHNAAGAQASSGVASSAV